MSQQSVLYFRNFIFGVEDSLVSTVGLLSGIAVGGVGRDAILLTGTVLILVEALSMAAGSFLSESSVQEYEVSERKEGSPLWGGAVMFASYFAAGFVPLLPYVYLDSSDALGVSVGASLIALFVLGVIGGTLSRGSLLWRGVRMVAVGGLAIAAGLLAGSILSI